MSYSSPCLVFALFRPLSCACKARLSQRIGRSVGLDSGGTIRQLRGTANCQNKQWSGECRFVGWFRLTPHKGAFFITLADMRLEEQFPQGCPFLCSRWCEADIAWTAP